MSELTVGPGTQVTLHFSLAFESGDIIDSNFDAEPATFVFGDGQLLQAFEDALLGLAPKSKASFLIAPEDAFGLGHEDNIKSVSRGVFSEDTHLQPGMVFGFKDASGGEVPGVITELSDTAVTVDFNHPLAGKTIAFKVEIIDVKPS